ncbi:uncharacterized protein MYCGRDRAFT_95074 [Zymoseptoria tritici IPO323]|uniref:Uncharacterized protein n=1 Tax=Zymoseptoria tritici (strain CBS 115943 / IPO323) TaxID=336722 RepID=F9XH83_ZYMTI|nr:uncharacterized protein MYCGRDRAFT_95074 [Zymoseptoria tritici IPO323]EGP84962.1 hypothetical protein MYCGRDRAFT_95074 [Zymoseptoria tritici IPO323]
MAAAFANSPEAIAVLAVIQALMDSKVEVHRGGEFWALVSAKVRTEHGFNIGSGRAKKMHRMMRTAAPSGVPDARKFLQRAARSHRRRKDRAAREEAGGLRGAGAVEGEGEGEEEGEEEAEKQANTVLPVCLEWNSGEHCERHSLEAGFKLCH